MVELAKIFLEFLAVYLLALLVTFIYSLFTIKKTKKNKMNITRKNAPIGIKYLMYKYNLDVAKIGFDRLNRVLYFIDAFIIAFVYIITKLVTNVYIRMLVAFILVFPLMALVYYFVARYYKKESE